MVDSGLGRRDLAEVGRLGMQPRPVAEAEHGEVRKPRPRLTAVDAQPLEAAVEVIGERGRVASGVVEDEHPDAPRLAVAADREPRPARSADGLLERARDGLDVSARAAAEERECEVEVVPRDDPSAELPFLPREEALDGVVG
jgi:hypothetical protein